MALLTYPKYFFLLGLLFVLFLAYAPNLLDFKPQTKTLKVFKENLTHNEFLSEAEKLFSNEFTAPESFVIHEGVIYTGVYEGHILAIKDGKANVFANIAPDSRVLGLRIHKGKMFAIDAYNGLYSVDMKTGKAELVFSSVNGKKMLLPDDLDIDDSGKIYLSDASQRWDLKHVVHSFMEHEDTGRVILFDPATKKSKVLVEGLRFPNGIQISHDKKNLLIAETMEHRIMQYHLDGPRKGELELFADVPGEPDNIRPSSGGGYWVAMNRLTEEPTSLDKVSNCPTIRKCVANFFFVVGEVLERINMIYPTMPLIELEQKFKEMSPVLNTLFHRCVVIELNAEGKIIRNLESSDTSFCRLSEVLEHQGTLYLGSYKNPYLAKLNLQLKPEKGTA